MALPSRLLFVADASHASEGLPALVARAAAAGLGFIEIRRKSPLGTAARIQEARACLAAAPAATLLVNDRADVALAAGAHGAHLGQDDLACSEARRLLGAGRLLGLSTHDEEQFARGLREPVDYLALGPIHESRTKSGHAPAVGLEALARCCASTGLPVVAIGGLSPERAAEALAAGAAAVAVASALALGDLEQNAAAFARACGSRFWVLTGLPGSGKGRVGRVLAERSGRRYVDLDERVEREAGLSVSGIFEREGERGFRARELEALRGVLGETPHCVLALGGGTPTQEACRELLDRSEARLVWLDASPAECARRLAALPETRPLLAGRAAEPALAELLAARRGFYAQAELRLNAEASPAELAEQVQAAWSEGGQA